MAYPSDFLWGAATSSHQVEGNNTNNDWWQWEEAGKTKAPSGAAADHYHRYLEDFDIAQSLGHNAHRFSVEWSRIEPKEGEFDQSAMDHYKKVVAALRQRSIEPVITLHHFTSPLWLQAKGGWLNRCAVGYFERYCLFVADALGADVRFWITINEPMVYALYGYVKGLWPPGTKSHVKAFRVVKNMAAAHKRVYRALHGLHRQRNWARPMVGFSKNYRPFLVCPDTPGLRCRLGTWWRNRYFNFYYLNKVRRDIDFIGINYYELEYDSTDPHLKAGFFGDNCSHEHKHLSHQNQLGWGLFPEGLAIVFKWLEKYRKPLLITENGTCEDDDTWRRRFIEQHLETLDRAVASGVPVIGYLCWSLLDNFEWHHGLTIRFGIVGVNYETFEREIRPSALHYHNMIAERNP